MNRRVFVLEDDETFREILVRHLAQGGNGWEIRGVGSLKDGMGSLIGESWDLVVSDLTLADISAEPLLRALRNLQPNAALVVVTGRTEEDLALRALGLGAQEYLLKGGLSGDSLRRAARHALERKRIERELENTRLVLSSAMDSFQANVALIDEEGRVVACNAAWKRHADALPYVVGIKEGDHYRPTLEALATLEEVSQAAAAVGILGVFAGRLPTFKLEFPWPTEGRTRWYGLTASGFRMEDRIHTLLAFNDITRSMETSQELRRNQHLFRILSDHIQDLVAIVDRQGKRLFESPSYTTSLGWSREEMLAMDSLALVHPDDLEHIKGALYRIFELGKGTRIEYRMRTKAGNYRYFESQSAPVMGPDGVSEGALFCARDVSDRKEAERDRDRLQGQLLNAHKLESIGQLAAGIAHEINTPIQYIGDNTRFLADSFAQLLGIIDKQRAVFASMNLESMPPEMMREIPKLLLDQDFYYLSEEIPKAAEETLEGVDRVGKIIKALKEFSYPMGEDAVVMDVNKGVESTLTVARNEWKYHADLVLDLDPTLPLVPGFPGEFNQVVLNMTVNAVHAIQDVLVERGVDKGLLKIKTRAAEDGVLISFEDNGKGIPESIKSRIFDPFFTTKGVGRGTGQGLSIVHSVMEKHQGHITLESEVGVGTTFTLWLPKVRKEAAGKEAP